MAATQPRLKRSSRPRVPGFRAAGMHCGIKPRDPDLALIVSDVPATVAGVFTRSTIVGAPVVVSRARVRRGRARGVVVNSGVANVAMGSRGLAWAETMTSLAAKELGCESRDILVASTGVIGAPLPMAALRRGIPELAQKLEPGGLADAARAILTTDTVSKLSYRRFRVGARTGTLAGIAKGVGMLEPNMATMLAFLMTDVAVAPVVLRGLLREAVGKTLNCITVDGETSTSDTTLLFANGLADNPRLDSPGRRGARQLAEALEEVCGELAEALVRDGEGATRLVRVVVEEARTERDADRAARRIANSPLVKTALFGRDPNWGRILQTVGAARVSLDLERAEVRLCGVPVFADGRGLGPGARSRARKRMQRPEIEIRVRLASGRASARILTCDLSYDYVKINAEYTT